MGGCAISKIGNGTANNDGNQNSASEAKNKAEADGRLPDVRDAFLSSYLKLDPRCPLDERQVYGLTKSWKAINRNMSVTAINMFVRLFETNPDIKAFFSKFKDVTTIADLRSSKVLEGHALKVICTIDDVIVNLDDMDYVLRMLQIVAQSHVQRFPHFDPEFFWKIEEPFVLAVKEELGDRFTISMETAYRTIINFIVSTLNSEFKKGKEAQLAQTGGLQRPAPKHENRKSGQDFGYGSGQQNEKPSGEGGHGKSGHSTTTGEPGGQSGGQGAPGGQAPISRSAVPQMNNSNGSFITKVEVAENKNTQKLMTSSNNADGKSVSVELQGHETDVKSEMAAISVAG